MNNLKICPFVSSHLTKAVFSVMFSFYSSVAIADQSTLAAPGGKVVKCSLSASSTNGEARGTVSFSKISGDAQWAPFAGVELITKEGTVVYRLALVRYRDDSHLTTTQALYPGPEMSATEYLDATPLDGSLQFSLRWDEVGRVAAQTGAGPTRNFGVKRTSLQAQFRVSGGTAKIVFDPPYSLGCQQDGVLQN